MAATKLRVLLTTFHSTVDPSNGAAHAMRDLTRALAEAGWECRVLCGSRLDFLGGNAAQLNVLRQMGVGVRQRAVVSQSKYTLVEFMDGNVPTTIYMPEKDTRPAPTPEEGEPFARLHAKLLDSFQPNVMITYGGYWIGRKLLAQAKERKTAVVFALANQAYKFKDLFDGLHVHVPSQFMADAYRRNVDLDTVPIPPLLDVGRVRAEPKERKYLTMVSPGKAKGIYFAARIFEVLAKRYPDIPVLLVEGRGNPEAVFGLGLDLSSATNLFVMRTTTNPKDFYAVSKAVLMPSLSEPYGLVAVESLVNGIPVLGCKRAGLLEALAEGGTLLDIPAKYTDETTVVATEAEVEPWVDAIVKLWRDPEHYEAERARASAAGEKVSSQSLLPRYEEFLRRIAATKGGKRGDAKSWLIAGSDAPKHLGPKDAAPEAVISPLTAKSPSSN